MLPSLLKNEAATHGYVQQLLELALNYMLGDAPDLQPLYLFGCSHCLSDKGLNRAGWQRCHKWPLDGSSLLLVSFSASKLK